MSWQDVAKEFHGAYVVVEEDTPSARMAKEITLLRSQHETAREERDAYGASLEGTRETNAKLREEVTALKDKVIDAFKKKLLQREEEVARLKSELANSEAYAKNASINNDGVHQQLLESQEREARLRAALEKIVNILCDGSPVKNGQVFQPGTEAAKLLSAVDACHPILRRALESTPEPRLAGVVRGLWKALESLDPVCESGEDGMRLFSCCNSKHCNETLMAGDRIFRLSYIHTEFDKVLSDADQVLREMGVSL